MEHIMISVRPQYVCKILNREKILEIRKSIPKEVLNGEECLVEMYCTKGKPYVYRINDDDEFELDNKLRYIEDSNMFVKEYNALNGKVVARWYLKKYDEFEVWSDVWLICDEVREELKTIRKNSCLSQAELLGYLGKKHGYGWHIDNLEIYDTPKELSEFYSEHHRERLVCEFCGWQCFEGFDTDNHKIKILLGNCIKNRLKRPPQSWCYIE